MKRLAMLLAAIACASCAHVPPSDAAPLTFSFTMPTQENNGACGAPILLPLVADSTLRAVYTISGPVALRDSVYAPAGVARTVSLNVPSGAYSVTIHATKGPNYAGCDATRVFIVVNPPHTVSIN